MDDPYKLATRGIQTKQNTTQYMLDTNIRKQTGGKDEHKYSGVHFPHSLQFGLIFYCENLYSVTYYIYIILYN
jgi:hypothetical protein